MINEETPKNTYAANGVQTEWPYTFTIINTTDIKVHSVAASGAVTEITANFRVDTDNNQVIYPTPESELDPAVVAPSGMTIVISRAVPKTQAVGYKNMGAIPAASIEASSDKVVMLVQDLAEQVSRCPKYPIGAEPATSTDDFLSDIEVAKDAAETAAVEAAASESAAQASASAASAAAGTATTQAGTATTAAGTATTQAGIATTKAGEAAASAGNAATSEVNAATSAATSTTKAGDATTQAGVATTKAGEAAVSAQTATTKAGEASASADAAAASAQTASTKAGEAAASATTAQEYAASIDPALFVHKAGEETISGVKTFSANPVLNSNAIPDAAIAALSSSKLSGDLPAISGASLTGLTKSQVGLSNVTDEAQIAKSIGTSKGDIIVFTGNATPVRLGVGDDGQVLVADSTQAGGLKFATPAGGGAPSSGVELYADQFENPVNADWYSNSLAPTEQDAVNNGLIVRSMDDTTREGFGFSARIPSTATSVTFKIIGRAKTAPAGTVHIKLDIAARDIRFTNTVNSWTNQALVDHTKTTLTNYFEEITVTKTLATWGWTAGSEYQFQVSRDPAVGSDLTGDFFVRKIEVVYS